MNSLSIESHFEAKAPVVRKIYDQVIKALKPFGRVIKEPKKTSIHLVTTSATFYE